jgi:hypothetical protein
MPLVKAENEDTNVCVRMSNKSGEAKIRFRRCEVDKNLIIQGIEPVTFQQVDCSYTD